MTQLSATPAHLDVFTVKVMTLVTVLVVSFATLFACKQNRRVEGLRTFSLGLLSLAAGSVLGIGRVFFAGSSIIMACNVFMVGGMVAVTQGLRKVRGFRPLPRPELITLLTAVSLAFGYWLYVREDIGMRVAVISFAFMLLSLDATASMLRQGGVSDRPISWPTSVTFAFVTVYQAVRAAGALTGSYGAAGIFSPLPVELGSTICANIAYIGCTYGMLMASNSQLTREAERLAFYDLLTGLPNRRLLLDRMLAAERLALTEGRGFGVVYLDLDGFKQINDVLGHAAGDDLLRRVSHAMTRVLGPNDCLGRIGGDEFVVLIDGAAGHSEVDAVASLLKAAVEDESAGDRAATGMRVSCGTAIFPEDGYSAHDVMRKADLAMYDAKKRNRRGRITIRADFSLASASESSIEALASAVAPHEVREGHRD